MKGVEFPYGTGRLVHYRGGRTLELSAIVARVGVVQYVKALGFQGQPIYGWKVVMRGDFVAPEGGLAVGDLCLLCGCQVGITGTERGCLYHFEGVVHTDLPGEPMPSPGPAPYIAPPLPEASIGFQPVTPRLEDLTVDDLVRDLGGRMERAKFNAEGGIRD